MEPPTPIDLPSVLTAARHGSRAALGQLLENCRNYLLLVANRVLEAELRSKVGASDLVQETFLLAQQNFDRFQGGTEAELLAWLRRILLNHLGGLSRKYRDAQQLGPREVPLDEARSQASQGDSFATRLLPATARAAREQDAALQQALERLPEHYRQVIRWRNYDCLPFEEIGRRLDRSADAARKLWTRALEQLEQRLEPHNNGAS